VVINEFLVSAKLLQMLNYQHLQKAIIDVSIDSNHLLQTLAVEKD